MSQAPPNLRANFQYDVRIIVPLPDGSTGTRLIDIVAMKPGQDLSTGRYEEIKSTISDTGVRRVKRRVEKVVDVVSKASRITQASNQTINDYYLNEHGATIHSTGQKIKPGSQTMYWSVWKFTNRTDKSGTRIGSPTPILSPKLNTKLIVNYLP